MNKLFGLLDFVTGLTLIFMYFNLLKVVGSILAIYLIIKGLLFIKNIVSMIDIICGIFILFASLGYFYYLDWVVVVWMIQKGVFSVL